MSWSSLGVGQWALQTSFWLLNVFGCRPLLNYRVTKPCMSSREQETPWANTGTPRGMMVCSLNISDRLGTALVRSCLALSLMFSLCLPEHWDILSLVPLHVKMRRNMTVRGWFIESMWETKRRKTLCFSRKEKEIRLVCVFSWEKYRLYNHLVYSITIVTIFLRIGGEVVMGIFARCHSLTQVIVPLSVVRSLTLSYLLFITLFFTLGKC